MASINRSNPSDPEFHRADWPFYWIARVNRLYMHELERVLRVVGCDVPTFRVLAILQEQGTCSVSEITVHAVSKLSTTTKIVYRMKADGLVDTATSDRDGRVTVVSITDEGQKALLRIKDVTHDLFERSFAGLTPAKLERLNDSLRAIFRNLHGGNHPILESQSQDDY